MSNTFEKIYEVVKKIPRGRSQLTDKWLHLQGILIGAGWSAMRCM